MWKTAFKEFKVFKFLKSCFPLILLGPFFNIFTQLCRRKINFLNQIQFKKSIYLIECFLLQVHEDPFHIVRFQRYFMHIRINVIDSNFDRLFPYSLDLQSLCNKSLEKTVSNRLTNFQDTVVFFGQIHPKVKHPHNYLSVSRCYYFCFIILSFFDHSFSTT